MSSQLERHSLWRRAPRAEQHSPAAGRGSARRRTLSAVAVLGLTVAMAANTGNVASALGFGPAPRAAVLPTLSSSTQFDITGFLQAATVDTPQDPHSGGTATINGHRVVIPRETVVILPASALTWQELFAQAPAPYGPSQTGMALADSPTPLTTYEVHVVGNRVLDPNGRNGCAVAAGCDRYIAGLVDLSQQDLNTGVGYINYIDYGTGELEVGGTLGVKGTGARVQINDPANPTSGNGGRFGRATSPDARFQVDQDNPTIAAETGFPMCVPRTDPTGPSPDLLCPESNRPTVSSPVADTSGITPQPNPLVAGEYYRVFRMDAPATVDAGAGCLRTPCADPRKQAPFEIGDFVNFAGTLEKDAAGAQYISAHTVTASLGIYTQPGVDPAYVTIEVGLIGTGGLTVFGAGEAAVRTRFEGMSTDETRLVRLYGVDINPVTGATSDREFGTIVPDPGPPAGAVRGRWRFRPPCTAAVATDRACTPPPSGNFLPPPREVRAVVDGLSQFNPGTTTANPNSQVPGTASAQTSANGIFYGQYHAPIGEYIFPENVPGTAVPENNFNTISFLAYGGYQSLTGVQAGVLNPWPSNQLPSPFVCATAAINGAPYSVANGASIQLSGGVNEPNATGPVTLQWTAGTAPDGTDLNGALTGATTTTPTFNATGLAAGTYNLALIVTGPCGVNTAHATITVTQAPPPSINAIQNQTVTAGNQVTINASSPSNPTPTWAWAAVAGNPAAPALTQTPSPATASPTSALRFTPTVAGTYRFTVRATNANGTSSPVTVTITVTAAVPANITLTNEYRTGKQRLIITATTPDPNVTTMVLQPYLTENGTTFDPTTLGANLTVSLTAPGTWTLTAVGAPRPACNLGAAYATPCAQTPITVKSFTGANVVGTSPPSALTRIRT